MLLDRLQRLQAVSGEQETHRAVANLSAEFLQHERFQIGLVIDKENGRSRHAACPALGRAAIVRGSVIMTSVNEPGCVSTLSLLLCCCTPMSCLILNTHPAPSPAGSVWK